MKSNTIAIIFQEFYLHHDLFVVLRLIFVLLPLLHVSCCNINMDTTQKNVQNKHEKIFTN